MRTRRATALWRRAVDQAYAVALLMLAGGAGAWAAPDVPPELGNAWDYRCAPRTTHMEWAIRSSGYGCDGRERFFTTRISGPRWAVIEHGDAGGLQTDPAITTRPDYVPRLHFFDEAADEMWVHNVFRGNAERFEKVARGVWRGVAGLCYDVRLLGFAWSFGEGQNWAWVRAPEGVTGYTVRREENGLCSVTAHDAEGGCVAWFLDPSRGWQPVRTTWKGATGSVIVETVTEYTTVDGRWSAALMKQTLSEPPSVTSVEIIYASYDRPSHRAVGPRQIGIVPGMHVESFRASPIRPPVPGETRIWDGQAQVTQKEWQDMVTSKGADDHDMRRYLEWLGTDGESAYRRCPPMRGPFFWMSPETDAPHNPELWEAVVRAFVIEHRLGRAEATKVWSLCEDCEAEAFAYLDQHKAEIEQIHRQLRGATPAQAEQLNLRLDRLYAPVEAIFRSKLKPSLKLPLSEPGPGNESSTATDTNPASSLPSS